VNDETIALDEIRRVGITGEFMSSPHTYEYFRGNIFEPRLGIRLPRAGANQRDNLIARAEDRVETLLNTPRSPTMDEETRKELLKIEDRYSRT
jgi:trimethylamine:corrinoid methyltransferase-like protein